MGAYPERISCLMVTKPCLERFDLFQRSVACFLGQTYPERELVVVLDEGPAEWIQRIKAHLAGLSARIVLVEPVGKRTLGALRNLSVDAASGDLVCVWDDDDLCHPTRLAQQYALLRREDVLGVGIQDVLHLFLPAAQMFWTSYRSVPVGFHCPTLMYRRGAASRYPEEGPQACVGEDNVMLRALQSEGRLLAVEGAPYLYIYVCHGTNTDGARHGSIARRLAVSKKFLERRRPLFDQLSCFDLGDHPIQVLGSNGLAFEIPGRPRILDSDHAGPVQRR